ncbi:hypothetical protein [Flavobacterium poyangense]|uniref:hypothetical protein n=1 Tax=Flavobacterium poyangense TaxID=2204302 RepID=UPI001421E081|nr:hypothetical protein [Flavobacterium sp. JXAS1]
MKNLNSLVKNDQKQLVFKCIFFIILFLLSTTSYSQEGITHDGGETYRQFISSSTRLDRTSLPHTNLAFILGDATKPRASNNFSWWANGASNKINNLMMSLVKYSIFDVPLYTLSMHGIISVQNMYDRNDIGHNLMFFVDDKRSYIQSNGDQDGLYITSTTGNKIEIGDHTDAVAINAKNLIMDYGGANDLAQVAINAGNPVNGAALTVGGMTYIGSSKVIESHPEISNDLKEDCSLFVEKQILAADLNIIPKPYWKDSVFEGDYKKMDLNALESYVKENKHLPGIVSEKEVKEKGYKIHVFNEGLLQNVEELLLHIIDQNKKITDQSKKIEVLSRKIEVLEKEGKQHKK